MPGSAPPRKPPGPLPETSRLSPACLPGASSLLRATPLLLLGGSPGVRNAQPRAGPASLQPRRGAAREPPPVTGPGTHGRCTVHRWPPAQDTLSPPRPGRPSARRRTGVQAELGRTRLGAGAAMSDVTGLEGLLGLLCPPVTGVAPPQPRATLLEASDGQLPPLMTSLPSPHGHPGVGLRMPHCSPMTPGGLMTPLRSPGADLQALGSVPGHARTGPRSWARQGPCWPVADVGTGRRCGPGQPGAAPPRDGPCGQHSLRPEPVCRPCLPGPLRREPWRSAAPAR